MFCVCGKYCKSLTDIPLYNTEHFTPFHGDRSQHNEFQRTIVFPQVSTAVVSQSSWDRDTCFHWLRQWPLSVVWLSSTADSFHLILHSACISWFSPWTKCISSACQMPIATCFLHCKIHLHLHLVIWQTLLSKATYNWWIHKAIHLEETIRQRKCS